MRLIFAGTPRFAALALEALHDAGHDIALVLTQPDRPAGRGLQMSPSDVKRSARSRGLEVFQPPTLRSEAVQQQLAAVQARTMVVAAYGLILPPAVLSLFPLGCINIHASLLPRWRGAAPIQRALLAGDRTTGISIMQMEAGLDTGPVLTAESLPIGDRETASLLHDRLAALGASLIVRTLPEVEAGATRPVVQDDASATYAAKITRPDTFISWTAPADVVDRCVRAFDPVPGAVAQLGAETVKIWRAEPAAGGTGAEPGTVVDVLPDALVLACGEGTQIRVFELQRAGGKRLPVRAFLLGCPVQIGQRFSSMAAG